MSKGKFATDGSELTIAAPLEEVRQGPDYRGKSRQVKEGLVNWVTDLTFVDPDKFSGEGNQTGRVAESPNVLHERLHKTHQLLVHELAKTYQDWEELADFKELVTGYRVINKEIEKIGNFLSRVKYDVEFLEKKKYDSLRARNRLLTKMRDSIKNDIVSRKQDVFKGVPGFEDLRFGDQIIEDLPHDDIELEMLAIHRDIEDSMIRIKLLEERRDYEIASRGEDVSVRKKRVMERFKGLVKPRDDHEVGTSDEFRLSANRSFVVSGRGVVSKHRAADGSEITIDHSSRAVDDIEFQKRKGLNGPGQYRKDHEDDVLSRISRNMVLANFSFIVDYEDGVTRSVSVPIRVGKDQDVVNFNYVASLPDYIDGSIKRPDSEQFLFALLRYDPDTRMGIIDRFAEEIRSINGNSPEAVVKIREMIVDLHSSRYMCDSCVKSAIDLQSGADGAVFLEAMTEGLKRKGLLGLKIDAGCGVSVRASAGVDFADAMLRVIRYDSEHATIDRKRVMEMDIRDNPDRNIKVSREGLGKSLKDHTLFISGKDKDLRRFSGCYLNVASFQTQRGDFDLEGFLKRYQEKMLEKTASDLAKGAIKKATAEVIVEDVVEGVVDRALAEIKRKSEERDRPSPSPEGPDYSVGVDGDFLMEF